MTRLFYKKENIKFIPQWRATHCVLCVDKSRTKTQIFHFISMPARLRNSGNTCNLHSMTCAEAFIVGKTIFGKMSDILPCRIGLVVPVIIVQVSILVP